MAGVIPEKVNAQQEQAITHGDGPLLIVAGAGTGKTTVITERLAYLIQEKNIPLQNILALTFTEKAAEEMCDRVEKILPYGFVDLWVMTFHSFGQKILQQHALDIGLPNDFHVLTQADQWMLIRRNLEKFDLDYYRPRGNPTKFISALIRHFSRLKDEHITPAEYLKFARGLRKGKGRTVAGTGTEEDRVLEVAKAYETYQQLLDEEGGLDFGDLIICLLDLLKKRPAVLAKFRQQFQYVLVDEFQDTNWAQYELIKLIAAPKNNLTVVGDDDQSIYKFRGASVSNILSFRKDFAKSKVIVLSENYRNKQNILDLAYTFIQKNNPDRLEAAMNDGLKGITISKKLNACRDGQGIVELMPATTQEAEAKAVLEKIQELKSEHTDLTWNDFCIVVRANDHATVFIDYLQREDIPYTFLAAKGLFRQPVILDILSYVRLLDDYHEDSALYRLMNVTVFGIKPEDIRELLYQAKKGTMSLYEAAQVAATMKISPESQKGITTLLLLITKHSALTQSKTVGEIILTFLHDSGYLMALTKAGAKRVLENTRYLNQFYKEVEAFERSREDKSVTEFMRHIDLLLESGEEGSLDYDVDTGPESVKILTMHSAKGLEWPYVFIVNVVEQRFPSMERRDPIEVPDKLIREKLPIGDAHLQEERRLMYVAITRARDGVFFTAAEDYGGKRKKKPSAFLYELGILPEESLIEKTTLRRSPLEYSGLTSSSLLSTGGQYKKTRQPLTPKTTPPMKVASNEPTKNIGKELFSFTKLATYTECPWRYRYAFILRVPRRESFQLSYGKTMHTTLLNFFTVWNQRKNEAERKVMSKKPLVSLEELLRMYEQSFINEWYETKKQRQEYHEKGKVSLTGWYKLHAKKMPEVLRLEQPFKIKVEQYTVNGSIDRVDAVGKNKETGKDIVNIVDYKTGAFKDKTKGEDKYQLFIYMMAAQDPAILNADVNELQYYFLDENQGVGIHPVEKDVAQTKEWISSTIKSIQSGDFHATPGIVCKFCDFREICEYRAY